MTAFIVGSILFVPINYYLLGVVGSPRTRVARHYVRTVMAGISILIIGTAILQGGR
jgi:hypothetical protein